jgi:photosystem II stability/assembly factor-like uncharacterized protein
VRLNIQPYDIRFLNAADGLIAGSIWNNDGMLKRTNDGGHHWLDALTGRDLYPTLFDVVRVDGYRLFATGYAGIRLVSQDGGQSWSEGGSSVTYASISGLDYDGVRGFAIASGALLRTLNGGQTWRVNVASDAGMWLNDVQVLDDVTFACGDGVFLRSTDSGANWDTLTSDDRNYRSLSFVDPSYGWRLASTLVDTVYRSIVEATANAGHVWVARDTLPDNGASQIDMVSWSTGWVLAGRSGPAGLWRTTTGGESWDSLEVPGIDWWMQMDAVDSLTVWLARFRSIWVSHDAGETWDSVAAVEGSGYATDISFATPELGAVGIANGRVMVTTNGGASWNYYSSRVYGEGTRVKMLESGTVLVGGAFGSLFTLRFGEGANDAPEPHAPVAGSIDLTAYPNPFNPDAELRFALDRTERVTLAVYNLNGRRVETLTDGVLAAGQHAFVWNAAQFASGIYFARLQTEHAASTTKLALLR